MPGVCYFDFLYSLFPDMYPEGGKNCKYTFKIKLILITRAIKWSIDECKVNVTYSLQLTYDGNVPFVIFTSAH